MIRLGERVGPWKVLEIIGKGGNATVCKAVRDDDPEPVAVKFLDTKKTGSERYRRFVQEVEVLRDLEALPGILPLLDAHLPDRPTRTDPAWLSMPLAIPVATALAGKPLETVVEAVAKIAHTLATLADRGISHRDVKPGNLYRYEDHWVVGDFGLVAVPDGEALTRNDKRFGPEHFAPYEMVTDPISADPKSADVFMLAKTLWVLTTGKPFPPGGHQPSTEPDLLIANLRPHLHADAIDELVDRATLLRPESRPTMAAFAADLDVWRLLGEAPGQLDVTDVLSRVRQKLREEIDSENTEEERRRMARAAADRLQRHCRPLNVAMLKLDGRAEIDRIGHALSGVLHPPDTMGSHRISYADDRVSSIRSGPKSFPYAVSYGWALDLDETGMLSLRAVVYVGHEEVIGSDFWWQSETRQAAVGSIAVEKMIEETIGELRPELLAGLKVFSENLE